MSAAAGASAPAGAAGTAAATAVVATSCPACGAPLEVGETANATACGHCRTRLVVTGRGRVLSYQIAPRIPAGEARASARFAAPQGGGAVRVGDPRLYLFPYHRLSGLQLRWSRPEDDSESDRRARLAKLPDGMRVLAEAAFAPRPRPVGPPVFAGRWLERTVSACEGSALVPWSLGVRSSVLRLDLFRPPNPEAAAVVAATVPLADALARGPDAGPGAGVLHETVLHRLLALVYFPFWVIEVRAGTRRHAAIVDGTAGTITAWGVDPERLAVLVAPPAVAPPVLGFRPLVCPNCGWDLPVDPCEVVFHCATCQRAWQLAPDRLEPVAYTLIAPPAAAGGGPLHHLPVWIVGRGGTGPRRRTFAPAFRFRQLRRLVDLGRNLSRVDPPIRPQDGPSATPLGHCHLDRADARALADFVVAGLAPEGASPRDLAPPSETTLAWLPFGVGPYAFRDLFSGTSLPKRLLD